MKTLKTVLILFFSCFVVLLSAQTSADSSFGESPAQVHKVTATLETRKQPAVYPVVNLEELLSSGAEVKSIDNRWNLEDGVYLAKEILVHSPELIRGTKYRGPDYFKTAGVLINQGQMYIFSVSDESFEFLGNGFTSLGGWTDPILKDGVNKDEGILFYCNERSGGGDYGALVFDGTNLNILFFTAEFSYTEQVTYILEKDAKNISIRYDIDFPLYVNLEECRAFSTSNVRRIPDVLIKGNQRDLREEYYFAWGPLSEEGKSNIVELVDLFQIHGIWVYEGIYQGKSVFIKKEAISNYPRIYTSIDNLESAIWYENGL